MNRALQRMRRLDAGSSGPHVAFQPDERAQTPGYRELEFRLFFEMTQHNFRTLLLLTFQYHEELDWYEVKVFRGQEQIGYTHGYANQGWNPQVNNIWVVQQFRRKGIGSLMMARVEDYFGQVPLPGTPISDNEPARLFWRNYLTGRSDRPKKAP
jgi:GNAT superfamily N-acetyltransferase